jgi:hypothetical protein
MITWQWLLSSIRRSSFRNSAAVRRQYRFRLVEHIDALPLTALLEESQKSFTVRMREEIRSNAPDRVEIARDREKTLRAEEPTLGDFGQPACPQRIRKVGA